MRFVVKIQLTLFQLDAFAQLIKLISKSAEIISLLPLPFDFLRLVL